MASPSRVMIAALTGRIAFGLVLLLCSAAGLPSIAGISEVALTGAALIAVWVALGAATLHSAWRRGCLVNGLLGTAVADWFSCPG
jgi:type IV secretory pathway VirB2 component (pilin)